MVAGAVGPSPEEIKRSLRAFAERLRAAGKCPKVVVVAVMRTLLELAWTLLRDGESFSRSQAAAASPPWQAQTVSPQACGR